MVLLAYTRAHEYHTLPRAINKTRYGLLLISQVRHVINVGSYTRIKNTCRCVYTRTRSLCAALISKVSFFTLNYVIHSVQFKSILCSISVRLCRFHQQPYIFCDRRWNSRRLSRWITVTYCRFRDFNHEKRKEGGGGKKKRSSILFQLSIKRELKKLSESRSKRKINKPLARFFVSFLVIKIKTFIMGQFINSLVMGWKLENRSGNSFGQVKTRRFNHDPP